MNPKKAKLLLGKNKVFDIKTIHFSTKQVTLQESEKVFNTVSISDVEFDFSGMSQKEILEFKSRF
ncbi:MAG: hypothetical protein VZQ61_03330 [Christensenellaceae bacterium]